MKKITTEPAQATFLTREEKIDLISKKIERLRRLGQLTNTDVKIDGLPVDDSGQSAITTLSPGPASDLSLLHLEKFLRMGREDSDAEKKAPPVTLLIEQGYFPTFPSEKQDEVKMKSVTFRSHQERIMKRLMRKKEGVRFESEGRAEKPVVEELPSSSAPFEEIESHLADIRILMHELYVDVPHSDCAFDKRMPHEFELPDLKPKEEAVLLTDDSESSYLTCPYAENHKKRHPDSSPRGESSDYIHAVCEDRVCKKKGKKLKLTSPEYNEENNEDLQNHLEKLKFMKSEKPRKFKTKTVDFKDLDFVAIMNAYEGNWAVDEDAFLSNFYFKFLHDSRWRRRIKKYGCFCLIDECTCGRRQPLTDAQMAKLPARHFFELEAKCDYRNVVERIRNECQARHLIEKNVEFLKATDPKNYSDSEVSEEEEDNEPTKEQRAREACLEEIRQDIGHVKPLTFAHAQRVKDDESVIGFSPRDKLRCGTIPLIKFTEDIAPPNEWKNIEGKTLQLYVEKIHNQKEDVQKGIKWRGKSLYRYKWPRFGHKKK